MDFHLFLHLVTAVCKYSNAARKQRAHVASEPKLPPSTGIFRTLVAPCCHPNHRPSSLLSYLLLPFQMMHRCPEWAIHWSYGASAPPFLSFTPSAEQLPEAVQHKLLLAPVLPCDPALSPPPQAGPAWGVRRIHHVWTNMTKSRLDPETSWWRGWVLDPLALQNIETIFINRDAGRSFSNSDPRWPCDWSCVLTKDIHHVIDNPLTH